MNINKKRTENLGDFIGFDDFGTNFFYTDTKIPSLTDSTYGETIADNFKIINDNFKRLSQLDYTKGDSGESLYIQEIDLSRDNVWLNAIKNAIKNMNLGGDSDIEGTSIFSIVNNIGNMDKYNPGPGKLYLLYSKSPNKDDKKYVSSLPYIFRDGRFYNKNTAKNANENPDLFKSLIDHSCALLYNPEIDGFETIQSFPTLYYDKTLGFCWNINGQKTSISAQGARGEDGLDGELYIVKVNAKEEQGKYKATKVLSSKSGSWIDINNHVDISKKLVVPAVVTTEEPIVTENGDEYPFWITTVTRNETGSYYANCKDDTRIDIIIDDATFENILNHISIDSQGIKGLYLPMGTGNGAHITYVDNLNTYIKPAVNKTNPRGGDIIQNAVLNISYNTTNFKNKVNMPVIVSGGFNNNDKILSSDTETDGRMVIISSEDVIKSPMNSEEGIREFTIMLNKYDILNPIRLYTSTMTKDTDSGFFKGQLEIPTTTIYTPQGYFNIHKNTANIRYFDINDEDDKETIDTYSTRDIIKYTSSNNEEVSYLKIYRLYKSRKLHRIDVGANLSAPIKCRVSSENSKLNVELYQSYMLDMDLSIYVDKFYCEEYEQDPDTKGNKLDSNGDLIVVDKWYEYEIRCEAIPYIKSVEQLVREQYSNTPIQLIFNGLIFNKTYKDELDYDVIY